ncbi:MAG: hypothetical protein HN348_06055 [Proteobacteria bacterium]|nr:hypothetical protein [Pseudomonadota bacterium]
MPTTPDLSSLCPALNADDFPTQYLPGTKEIPVDQVLVVLDDDQEGRTLHLQILPVPDIEDLTVLQFYSQLPFSLNPANTADLARFLHLVNQHLPLIGFAMNEDDATVYYRALVPQPEGAAQLDIVVPTVWMTAYLLHRFAPLVEGVAIGELAYEEGKAALLEHLSRPYDPVSTGSS